MAAKVASNTNKVFQNVSACLPIAALQSNLTLFASPAYGHAPAKQPVD